MFYLGKNCHECLLRHSIKIHGPDIHDCFIVGLLSSHVLTGRVYTYLCYDKRPEAFYSVCNSSPHLVAHASLLLSSVLSHSKRSRGIPFADFSRQRMR